MTGETAKRVAWGTLGAGWVLMVGLGIAGPMSLLFPLWIFTSLFREQLEDIFAHLPGSTGFLAAGIAYGMLIEIFAIVNSLDQPVEERVLLDGNPKNDLILGLLYYAFVIGCWYFLLRRVQFSAKDVFLITGVYGIVVEETGQVVLRMLAQPVTGTLYAILVMFVYGLFPMLALVVTGKRFPANRQESSVRMYALAVVALFGQYALYGNTVYPVLKAMLH